LFLLSGSNEVVRCVGEKRTLVIPAALGYGEQGAGGDIPGGAILNFEVECLGIKDGEARGITFYLCFCGVS
jgi:hypothetical protein